MSEFADFARLIQALRPWLGELVIVGGWAHRLHRFDPRARVPAYHPVRTLDADVAMASRARFEGDIGLALEAAEFEEHLSTDHTPPISHYRLGEGTRGFYAEFLTPLLGSGVRRNGTPDATAYVAGVTAQKLRYLDLLLVRPWTVRLHAGVGVPLSSLADVRLSNPVTFLAQKLLIQEERPPAKRAQDALYIHDSIELFAHELDALRAEWRGHVRRALPERTAGRVERFARQQFAIVTDVLREAARIPQDRALRPDDLRYVCESGLEAIFGPDDPEA